MPDAPKRRGSVIGATLLIAFGVLFLYANVRPEINPWPILQRYWPLLLIFWGLGKLWDYLRLRNDPNATPTRWVSGEVIAILLVVLLFGFALSRRSNRLHFSHQAESVDRKDATSVEARLDMPAGTLKLSGGATRLLEAQFDFDQNEQNPEISYDVSGGQGHLSVSQQSYSGIHFGSTHNDWNLHFNNDVPLDLHLNMGAGECEFRLGGLSLTGVAIQMGAGQATTDLRGDWKKNFDVDIQGGAGRAEVFLPKNVGVRVHAEGGLGTINTGGLRSDGGDYVNDAYGKSPVTIQVNVRGGVGEIDLRPEL